MALNFHTYRKTFPLYIIGVLVFFVLLGALLHDSLLILILGGILIVLVGLEVPLSLFYPLKVALFNTGLLIFLVLLSILIHLDLNNTCLLLGALAPFLLIGSSSGFIVRSLYKGGTDLVGVHTLTADEQGVQEKTVGSDTRYSWNSVSAIQQDKKRIYIYLGRLKAYIIPKDSFESATDSEAFYQGLLVLKQDEGHGLAKLKNRLDAYPKVASFLDRVLMK